MSSTPIRPSPAPPAGSVWRRVVSAPAWRRVGFRWPEILATLLLLAVAYVTVGKIRTNEGGLLVYTIDDCYFHMAVAKNLLQHGIWGTSATAGFSSGTSSLLWPLLITVCFALFGVREYWPLILNVLAAIGLLFYAGGLLRRVTGATFLNALVLLALVVLTPLFAVASTGMEHCLQCLLTLVFVDRATRLLVDDEFRLATPRAEGILYMVATLMVMTRYEGLFLVAPVGLLLLCRRRWLTAVLLGVIAASPIVLFGLLAVSKGWYFLPNSLLIKGNTSTVHSLKDLYDYATRWYYNLTPSEHMIPLCIAVAAAFLASLQRRWSLWTYPAVFLFIALVTTVEHLQFAALGWFYRYEAYLIVLGLVGVGVALGYAVPRLGWRYWLSPRPLPYYGAAALLLLLLGQPFWTRAADALWRTVAGSHNIYEQQYQMARFARRYYRHKGVAANDVGAISFFGDVDLLDLVGLCDIDVLRARRAGTIDNATVRRLSDKHHVELVVAYPEWSHVYGGVLPEWVPVGRWSISDNVIVAVPSVTFYAPRLDLVPKLSRELQEFSSSLPKSVDQEGFYRGRRALEITGSHGAEGPVDAMSFCTEQWANILMYPPAGAPLESPDTLLQITVAPAGKEVSLDVFVNDELVETKTYPPGTPVAWGSFRVKARWRDGLNSVRIMGRGEPVLLPNDKRLTLFRMLDPERVIAPDGRVVPQGVLTTATP